jgi:hypothetical protein
MRTVNAYAAVSVTEPTQPHHRRGHRRADPYFTGRQAGRGLRWPPTIVDRGPWPKQLKFLPLGIEFQGE